MFIKSIIGNSRPLRALLFPLFARFNPGDITIKHQHTGDRMRLHSFRHRGFWWHGKDREADVIAVFEKLIRPGDTVFDVGSHIGYLSLLFAHIVGRSGSVHAFEPGENNLQYTRQNLAGHSNITLVEKCVGAEVGSVTMYLEDLSGQNNSLVADYAALRTSSANAVPAHVRTVTVPMTTIDEYVASTGVTPAFLKIDVEGSEIGVLRGARRLFETRPPRMMVETAGEAALTTLPFLREAGYIVFRPDGLVVKSPADIRVNSFCLHPVHHAADLALLQWPRERPAA